jgi:group II intron reverse transcriptase/maturase
MNTQALDRLEQIKKKNLDNPNWINKDLYRLLYKEDIYIFAYENIKSNKDILTRGSSTDTLDGFSIKRIQSIIKLMRQNKYEFKPARKMYIPKPGKKTLRPLGISNSNGHLYIYIEDKVVQEVIRMILEVIYEPRFSSRSHGFRSGKSCHTALREVEQKFDRIKWLIEGDMDIKSAYDTVDHGILLNLLRKTINDERFILLIKRALTAGYTEQALRPRTSIIGIGTPQGSIISPILFNIYLTPFDDFIETLQKKYENVEKVIQTTTIYNSNATSIAQVKKIIDSCKESKTRNNLEKRILLSMKRKREKLIPICIRYIRYGDEWVVGVNGPRSVAKKMKQEIAEFLKQKLHYSLKTKITYLKEDIGLFLGYELRIHSMIKYTKIRNKFGVYFTKRSTCHFIKLDAPIPKLIARLCLKGFCNGKGKPLSKRAWTTMEDREIVRMYNHIMNDLFSYYSGADNQRKLIRIQYILQHSCACTLAHRHKSSVRKIYKKHGQDFQVKYTVETNKGPEEKLITLNLRKFNKTNKRWLGNKKSFKDPFQTYNYRPQGQKSRNFVKQKERNPSL